VLILRGACCFQSFLFPCCLVLRIPCLLVCLIKKVYFFCFFLSHSSYFFYM
jgi:hypothetical protein